MVEFIKENQYRLFIVIIMLVAFIGLGWLLIEANKNTESLNDFVGNGVNWILVIGGIFIYKTVKPLVEKIWAQTDIRDKIEEQRAKKLELENEKLRLEIEEMKRRLK